MHIRQLLAFATLGLAACSGTTNPDGGDFRIRVFNDSPYALTNVVVTVGEGEQFTLAQLARGGMSSEQRVHQMHENPAVTLTANGETGSAMPVEGFSGFNPSLVPGSYLVTIKAQGSPVRLEVTVSQPVED